MSVVQELTARLGFEIETDKLDHFRHKIDGIAESVRLLVGFELVERIAQLVEKFAGFGEHLESAAIQAGLTAEELQKLQYAASQNAVRADELSGGLARLGRVLFQAQKGSKGAAETFARLGIDKEQLSGFASTEEALYAIQDRIGGLATSQEKLAVVQQLFGRGGAKFLKFLQVGSEGTKRLGDEAERVGAIVSGRDIENLANFEDAASSLGQVIKSFFATIAGTVAPAFTRTVKALQNAWASSRESVMSGLKVLAGGFAYYMGIIIVLVKEIGQTIHAVVAGQTGIVGVVKSASEAIWTAVVSTIDGIREAFKQADADGSITSLFAQLSSLFSSLLSLMSSVAAGFEQALAAVYKFSAADTTKISAMAALFQKLANIIGTVAYGLNSLSDWFGFVARGGIGDLVGQKLFSGNANAAAAASGVSMSQQAMAAKGVLQTLGVPAVPPQSFVSQTARQPSAKEGAPAVTISSPITVNAAPGMDEKALADMVAKKQSDAWSRVLSETDRDHSFGHAY